MLWILLLAPVDLVAEIKNISKRKGGLVCLKKIISNPDLFQSLAGPMWANPAC
jgi:hypothetical protein